MTTNGKLRLNMATRPLRNTRFTRVSIIVLAASLAVLSGLAVVTFIKYGGMAREARAAVNDIQARISRAGNEEKAAKAGAASAALAGQARVDLVNSIILRKSFSWTGLLGQLEETLPAASYISSLAPGFVSETTLGLKIKVVSRNLDDVLALVTNLNARGFKKIRFRNETIDEQGQIIAEIEFDYERTL
jgi:hypothetical protein